MHILIAAMGSRGDVQPALALALGLRAAGHEPTVSAPPDFAAWAAELRLPFVATAESVEAMLKARLDDISGNPLRVLGGIRQILSKLLRSHFEETLEAAHGADAIVSCHAFTARSVAEKLKIPCFCVFYQPTLLRSSHHPPLMIPWQRLPGWLNRGLWAVSDWLIGSAMITPLNEARRSAGLLPIDSVPKHLFEGVPYFLAADPVLAEPPPDWRRYEVIATGPWFYEDSTELPPDVEAFLQAGPPPVYVGFGSMPSKDPKRLTKIVVDGACASTRRVLLSKGWAGIGEGYLPPEVKVVRTPMPHQKLFPRLAAVVHHGGSGTTATALRACVPQILVPHLLDQYYYAHRMYKLGLAPPGLPIRRLSASRLNAAIEAALALPPEPRRQAALRLRDGNGVARAVAILETRLQTNGGNDSGVATPGSGN